MTLTVNATHLPPLGSHRREEVGQQLQAMLVELIALSLLGKQLHWTVVGPHCRSLHLQLDELVDSWRELADTVAERAVAIGFAPDGQSATVARDSAVRAVEPAELADAFVVRELTSRLADVAERARERMDRLAELDAASQDVMVEVVRALEEQLWMVRVAGSGSRARVKCRRRRARLRLVASKYRGCPTLMQRDRWFANPSGRQPHSPKPASRKRAPAATRPPRAVSALFSGR